jgi:hypothetical protein
MSETWPSPQDAEGRNDPTMQLNVRLRAQLVEGFYKAAWQRRLNKREAVELAVRAWVSGPVAVLGDALSAIRNGELGGVDPNEALATAKELVEALEHSGTKKTAAKKPAATRAKPAKKAAKKSPPPAKAAKKAAKRPAKKPAATRAKPAKKAAKKSPAQAKVAKEAAPPRSAPIGNSAPPPADPKYAGTASLSRFSTSAGDGQ